MLLLKKRKKKKTERIDSPVPNSKSTGSGGERLTNSGENKSPEHKTPEHKSATTSNNVDKTDKKMLTTSVPNVPSINEVRRVSSARTSPTTPLQIPEKKPPPLSQLSQTVGNTPTSSPQDKLQKQNSFSQSLNPAAIKLAEKQLAEKQLADKQLAEKQMKKEKKEKKREKR